ncbi:hypothetical protein Tco_1112664 [Tanacetum coccineum]|uniref:Uncharacterized protein n=1 Tax=Tanacetum coccineum TaxID=301880 RepID=A0ABQ5IQI2_9ASTR
MDKELDIVEDLWDFIHVIALMLKKNPQEIHGWLMAVHAIGFKQSDLRIRVAMDLIGGEVLVFVPRSTKRENKECVHVGWGDVMGYLNE